VSAENGDTAGRYLIDLVDEMRAFSAQTLDNMAIVHNLMADVNRGTELFDRALDDLDRPFDTGAETSRLS
jgi:hypothetical protein